jgi:cellulose synthase/poly-beta-1,6-N-acetylglucosamine synthase-like glycosyltransferase
MPSYASKWFSRGGPHQRSNEDLLEAAVHEPLVPEAAQLRSQESVFEPWRNQSHYSLSNYSQVSIAETSSFVESPSLYSGCATFASPSLAPSSPRQSRHIRMTLSPEASSLSISNAYLDLFVDPSTETHINITPSKSNPPADPDEIISIQDPRQCRPVLSPRASQLNVNKEKDVSIRVASVDDSSPTKKPAKALRPFIMIKNFVLAHISPKTIWNMFDVRELLWPMTWKKYAVLAVIAALVAAIVVCELQFYWIRSAMEITRRNMLPVLVIVIGLEPAMITLMLLVARIPNVPAAEETISAHDDIEAQKQAMDEKPERTDREQRTALVIPCHNSDHEAFKRVMDSAFVHFHPSSIFIIDNARSMHPKNNVFRNFVRSLHPEINYIWSPIGSKNAAQLVGAVAAKNFDFIFTVDDDVCIPANFRAPVDKIDDVTKGVAFPLKATNADGNVPLFLVAWQDVEYRMAGLVKLAESDICGVLYPHGAGWFCERDTLIDLISNYHSLDFIAEDVNTGISMQKMKKRIAFDASCVLETEVPTTFLGPGLNWYNQRVRSWEMGRHGRLLAFMGRMLFSLNGQTTLHGIFWQKFVHFYSIACIIVDWVRVPVLVTMGGNGAYWRQGGLLMLVSMFPVLAYNYISCRRRPDMRTPLIGAMTIPIYKQIYALVSLVGAVRSILFYIGGHNKPKTVNQMVKDGDERAFWLDPRFQTNPAFLADAIEEKLS